MFVRTISESEATGAVAEIYRAEKAEMGVVMAATECWTARPDLLPAWPDFFNRVRAGFTLSGRDWRLITIIAAKRVPSTYCAHVYGRRLLDDLGSKAAVVAVLNDYRNAGLSDREVEMLRFANLVATNASKTTKADIDRLRAAGFSDPQISDIALCAALRCLLSRFVDAMGASPEAQFLDPDEDFRRALTVGKPV